MQKIIQIYAVAPQVSLLWIYMHLYEKKKQQHKKDVSIKIICKICKSMHPPAAPPLCFGQMSIYLPGPCLAGSCDCEPSCN